MYLTWHKFFFRDQDDHATLFADPPEAAARQGQSPQGINSAPNSGMARQGELKGSEVFEEPLEQETEADREFALQMFRRRRRRKQMEEGDVSLVTTAGEGETRKVSKRSKAARSKISRVEVLTKDCLWPLVALVTAVLALILFVLALLVIIANCLK